MVVAQASDAEVDPSIHPSIHLRQRHTDAGWKVAWQIPCCENRGLSLPPWPISASIDPVSRAALADRRLGGGLALHDNVQLLPLPPRWPVGLLACWLVGLLFPSIFDHFSASSVFPFFFARFASSASICRRSRNPAEPALHEVPPERITIENRQIEFLGPFSLFGCLAPRCRFSRGHSRYTHGTYFRSNARICPKLACKFPSSRTTQSLISPTSDIFTCQDSRHRLYWWFEDPVVRNTGAPWSSLCGSS